MAPTYYAVHSTHASSALHTGLQWAGRGCWPGSPHLNLFTFPQEAHPFTRIYYPLPVSCSLNPAPYFLLTWKAVLYLFTTFLHAVLHILQGSLHTEERGYRIYMGKDMRYLIKLASTFRQKSSQRYCPSPVKIHTVLNKFWSSEIREMQTLCHGILSLFKKPH